MNDNESVNRVSKLPEGAEMFYMVVKEGNTSSRVKHNIFTDAVTECNRLSGINPGVKFYITQAVYCTESRVITTGDYML